MSRYLYLGIFLFMIGCNIVNPDEKKPVYIRVPEVKLNATPYFSSDKHQISDVWVFADSRLIGVFETPAEFPVLSEEGEVHMKFFGGIWTDGMKKNRISYHFLDSYDTTINVSGLDEMDITPVVSYSDNFDIVFNEDFEDASDLFKASDNSLGSLKTSDQTVIDGSRSAILYAEGSSDEMRIVSKSTFDVPVRTLPAIMEFDYVSSLDFNIGVLSNGEKAFELKLRSRENATKIYADMASEVGVYSDTSTFRLFFQGIDPDSSDYIILDNIRMLIPNQ